MKKSKRGGKRKGAGRPTGTDNVVPVKIYPRQSRVDLLETDYIQQLSLEAVESEYRRVSKIKKSN